MWKNDHVAFQVADLDVALGFYTGVLGMRLMFRELDMDHHEAFAFLELDGGNLELLQCLDENNRPAAVEKRDIRPPYSPHLALATDDLDGLRERFAEQEVAIVKGPLEIPGKVRWLYIADPDHNVLEFVEWL